MKWFKTFMRDTDVQYVDFIASNLCIIIWACTFFGSRVPRGSRKWCIISH